MNCPKCGKSLEGNPDTCPDCGSDLGSGVEEKEITQEELTFGNTIEDEPKSKKPLYIGIGAAIVAVILVVIALVNHMMVNADPMDRLIMATKKSVEYKSIDAVSEIKFNLESMPMEAMPAEGAMVQQVLNDLSFKIIQKEDQEAEKGLLNTHILLKGNELTNIKLYYDKDMMVVEAPLFYDEPFYIKWDELDELVQNFESVGVPQIHAEEYKDFLFSLKDIKDEFKNIDGASYEAFFKEKLEPYLTEGEEPVKITVENNGNEKEISVDEIALTFTMDQYSDLFTSLLEKVAEDDAIQQIVKDKFIELSNIVLENGDYEFGGITKEQIEQEIADFDTTYDEGLDKIVDLYKNMNTMEQGEDIQQDMDITVVYQLDKDNNMRGSRVEENISVNDPSFDQPMEFSVTANSVINSINEAVDISTPDVSTTGINVSTTTLEEWNTLGQKIAMNLMGQVMSNPMLQDLFMQQ